MGVRSVAKQYRLGRAGGIAFACVLAGSPCVALAAPNQEPKSSEEHPEKHRDLPVCNRVLLDSVVAMGAGLVVYGMLTTYFSGRMTTVFRRVRSWNASLPKALAAQIMVRQSRVDTKVPLTRLRERGFELKELPDGKHILLEGKGMPGENVNLTFEVKTSLLLLADVSIVMTVEKGAEALGFDLTATKHEVSIAFLNVIVAPAWVRCCRYNSGSVEVELRKVALVTAPIPPAGTSELYLAVSGRENSRNYYDMDTRLRDGFEAYLRERGINKGLIKIVRTYAELKAASKEQQKDLQWIHKVQGFVVGK
ncbi:hypothetical protein JKP88DRAFT_250455 [Tribonema minus]|uniref:Uncharacterized protein n=1 Tax=Tribonema minus TaxID=303371 RepID=A0A835YJJ4_9STRA|nr:hypothetical protein JKP88DRAFT_250455 [Tribonema minus]